MAASLRLCRLSYSCEAADRDVTYVFDVTLCGSNLVLTPRELTNDNDDPSLSSSDSGH